MASRIFELSKIEIAASEATAPEAIDPVNWTLAENILQELAAGFPLVDPLRELTPRFDVAEIKASGVALPEVDARYRTLVEQIPAVVFMAFLDKGIGEAYVSPQVEAI